jgi:hypothetical protein
MIEKSFEPFTLRDEGWMGHYNLVVGYDDKRQSLTVQDSYLLNYAPSEVRFPRTVYTFIGLISPTVNGASLAVLQLRFHCCVPAETEKRCLSALVPWQQTKKHAGLLMNAPCRKPPH